MFGSNRFALMSPDGDDAAGGAAAGESSKDGSGKTPKGDDVVPKSQFLAALRSAEEKRERELAALRSEFESKLADATKPKTEPAKEYTRAELTAMVEDGRISQAQADAQIDLQINAKAQRTAAQTATNIVTEAQRKESVTSEIARYTQVVPELLNKGSKEFGDVAAQYRKLVAAGSPNTLATELAAIGIVHGPIETLEQARRGKPSHEAGRETGGSGGEQTRRKAGGPVTWDDLTPREKSHYQRGIDQGIYKDRAAVEAELKFAKSHVRQRMGARA